MAKRYQIFISSTYEDLKDERAMVSKAVADMGHIPAGMEVFPASDQKQWDFIKGIIHDSDYYILIIGGRYGSLADEDISYTEKEYRYAVEKGWHVLVFDRLNIESLPASKRDEDLTLIIKFRDHARDGRVAKSWLNSTDLQSASIISLQSAIGTDPRIGWVRGDHQDSVETLQKLELLRDENSELNSILNELKRNEGDKIDEIPELQKKVTIEVFCHNNMSNFKYENTWQNLWCIFGPEWQKNVYGYDELEECLASWLGLGDANKMRWKNAVLSIPSVNGIVGFFEFIRFIEKTRGNYFKVTEEGKRYVHQKMFDSEEYDFSSKSMP